MNKKFYSKAICFASLMISNFGFAVLESETTIQASLDQYNAQSKGASAALVIVDSGVVESFVSGSFSASGEVALPCNLNLGALSVSECLTKLELLYQSSKGLVNLEHSISKYLPDFFLIESEISKITLAELANHSLGSSAVEKVLEEFWTLLSLEIGSLVKGSSPAMSILNHILSQNKGSALQELHGSALLGSIKEISAFLSTHAQTINSVISEVSTGLSGAEEKLTNLEKQLGWIISPLESFISHEAGQVKTYLGFNSTKNRIVFAVTVGSDSSPSTFFENFLNQ